MSGGVLCVSQTDREKGARGAAGGEKIQPRIGAKLSCRIESEDGGAPICGKSPLPGPIQLGELGFRRRHRSLGFALLEPFFFSSSRGLFFPLPD
jgi:hypothetical protein